MGWRREFVLDQRNERFGCWVWVFQDGRLVSLSDNVGSLQEASTVVACLPLNLYG